MPAFAEPPRPSLTTIPDLDAVEGVGLLRKELARA
jgi:hypothetical protein